MKEIFIKEQVIQEIRDRGNCMISCLQIGKISQGVDVGKGLLKILKKVSKELSVENVVILQKDLQIWKNIMEEIVSSQHQYYKKIV